MATVEEHNAPDSRPTDSSNSADVDNDADSATSDDVGGATLERKLTNTEHTAVPKPGDVRINVKGAFIVEDDDEPGTPEDDFDTEGYQLERRGIRLPNHKAVVSHIAVDIGGSLAKLVYFSFEPGDEQGGRLNFLKFETDKIDTCIAFMKRLKKEHMQRNGLGSDHELCVMATGGGAYKYYERIKEALGVEVMREDEMECLIIGLDFFISEIPREVFSYSDSNPMAFVPPSSRTYPYLLVNIGSGVSMIKVSGPREFQRVGGTSLGGGTLWGLLSLLTGARNFDEMLAMAECGDNTNVDMLVGDIYGTGYGKIGLKSTTIASTFGKVYRTKRRAERESEDYGGLANGDHIDSAREYMSSTSPRTTSRTECGPQMTNSNDDYPGTSASNYFPKSDADPHNSNRQPFRPQDISRSLLYAISNNIGQLAFLHAEKHNCAQIYFGGSFIGGHWQTMATLAYAIKFWSKGTKHALFLRHEGYLGAVGAFLKRQPEGWGRRGSMDGLGLMGGVLEKLRVKTDGGEAQ
ncbi:pantothenate kinase [Verruconis gallopava]|uniref:Pantothenate kinase n=1 Tax=Verruconis gallopava TaxID=253628 RepID=A0A0D1Z501_9PEZI|nr:pantothenate kinase [Verruconis gallopava]KIW08007.1 pantothenate kinase [Verruconis gallopava]